MSTDSVMLGQLSSGSSASSKIQDDAGQRVATITNGVTSILVYDAQSKLVAEYGQAPVVTGGTQYVFTDHQGTTRVVTNQSGGVLSRQDYEPFGAELGAVGQRVSDPVYGGGNNVRQKYAGMEQDEASGMSHTLWRQYDSSSGRWTSPDPYGGSMTVGDPQSFNRYSYVNNDPVNKVDLLGLALSDIGVIQTDNPALAEYEEKNATWHTLRSTMRSDSRSSASHEMGHSLTQQQSQQQNTLPTASPMSQEEIAQAAQHALELFNQDAQVDEAFQTMREVLSTNNACSQFFGPGGTMGLNALQSVTRLGIVNNPTTNQPSPDIGISTALGTSFTVGATAAETIQNPTSMTVNTKGIFFNPRVLAYPSGVVQSNTPEGQAIQVAHETAHVVQRNGRPLIIYDGRGFGAIGPIFSKMNTGIIMKACLPAIRAVLTRQPNIDIGDPPPFRR